MTPGGKGANQAVAAAKLGAQVYFICKLGNDIFGTLSLNSLKKQGVNLKYVTQTGNAPSGVALIAVDKNSNNAIVVAPGANQLLTPQDIKQAFSDIAFAGAVVAQLEVPLETVVFAAKLAAKFNVPFILDPAPARKLPAELLEITDVIKPNETEAEILTGIKIISEKTACAAAASLLKKGVKTVILTMGKKGCLLANSKMNKYIPAQKVKPLDSTAAGDAFTGAIAFCIAQGRSILDSALFANNVAALSVTKMGAQSSMPTLHAVKNFIKSRRLL